MLINSTSTSSLYKPLLPLLIAFVATKFLLVLPLHLLVLQLGLQRWWRRRCSHVDVFTFHSAAVEGSYVLGAALYFGGLYFGSSQAKAVGSFLCSIAIPGEPAFHVLTCAERYLAVVHPVLYLGLRRARGVRIRNASIGCVWLLCVGWNSATLASSNIPYMSYTCFFALCLVLVTFCSLSVLRVLVRPGPGELGRDRAQGDQAKRRAFHTITAILGMQVLSFSGFLISFGLATSRVLTDTDGSLVLISAYWCSLPSSLALPVLFLQRHRI